MQLNASVTRNKQVTGLTRAKKIGILYEGTDREFVDIVRELVNELKEQQKDVSSLGFVRVKYEEDIPKSKLGMDFFGPKSLNFSLKSSEPTVLNFCEERFDILLDLNIDANPVLLNILAQSKAAFIVGINDRGSQFRDLYFDIPTGKEQDRDAKIKELKTIIYNIKKYTSAL